MSSAISTEQVMSLRTQTGAGIMDCKAALKEAEGDMSKAVEILRKKGIAGLAKRAGRAMKEGIVEVKNEGSKYAMVEINCETDFVAKNPDVRKFAQELVSLMLSDSSYANPAENEKAKESLQSLAMKTGENMIIRRGIVLSLPAEGEMGVYVHTDSKKAALVEMSFSGDSSKKEQVAQLARDLAMQCVAMGPKWLNKEDVPAEVIEKEKEIYKSTPQAQGKNEMALSKMLEGRIKKFYEESCLNEQAFIRDQKVKISDLIAAKGKELGGALSIKRFVSYMVGLE
ncbi:MAG: translation elongation factor Ts [Elusimicrobiota bacterium]